MSQIQQTITVPKKNEHISIDGLRPSDVDFMPPLLRSLALLLRLRGKPVSPQFLMSGLSGGKISPKACIRATRKAGMSSSIMYRPQLQNINPLVLPCILILQNDKACVLTSIADGICEVIFPETSETAQKIPLEDLAKDYTGYAIFASLPQNPEDRIEKLTIQKDRQWFWNVLKFYTPIYRHVALASIVVNLFAIASPLFIMNVYDRVIPNNAIETLWVLAIGIIIVYLANYTISLLRTHFVDTAGRNADIVLSSILMEKILSMRMDNKPESTGALANNIREFEQLREFFSSSSMIALIDLPFLFIFVFMTAFIGGPLITLPLIALPLLFLIGMYLQHLSITNAESGFKQNMHKNALLIEIINGLETIKTCMAESRIQNLWEKTVGISTRLNAETKKYAARAIASSMLVSQFVTVVLIIWGVYLIADGKLTMGGLIGCNILVGRSLAPMLQIATLMTRFQNAKVTLKTLDMLMQIPSENQREKTLTNFNITNPSFTMEDVSFAYPGTKKLVLDHVSLHIEPGERVGIIGTMGVGKTTLARLLLGLYQPTQGSIRFGDVDIRQIPLSDYRGRIGVLPQDVVLFYGTVSDNITMGDPTINKHMIMRAAMLSGVADFLKGNPEGLSMQVGEQGRTLSGGQRQAVALARALVRDPEILFLDEPSSNMDTDSEIILQNKLLSALSGRTLLLATHRLSMLRIVDRLIVLEKGTVKFDGPRDLVIDKIRSQTAERSRKQAY